MSLLTKQSNSNDLFNDLQSLLLQFMDVLNAEYLQLLYEPVGTSGYQYTTFETKKTISDPQLVQSLKNYTEGYLLPKAKSISPEDILRETHHNKNIGQDFLHFHLIPIVSSGRQLGVLIAGFGKHEPLNEYIDDETFSKLTAFLESRSNKFTADKEKIYALARTLINVQMGRQLDYILQYQINPLFGLASSAIICAKEMQSGHGLLLYTPNDYFGGNNSIPENLEPQILDQKSDSFLFALLGNANEELTYTLIDLERYQSKGNMQPYIKDQFNKGVKTIVAFHLHREHKIIGFWLAFIPDYNSLLSTNPGLLEPLIAQLSATVHNINVYQELSDKQRESEILLSLNMDLAATRDKNNLLKLIRVRLQKLFNFSHHFICKVNDDDLTISLLLSDSQSRSQYHPYYESVRASKFPIADGIYNKVLLSSEPIVFDLEKLSQRGSLPLHLQVNYDSGIKKVIMLALRVDSKVQGIWTIAFAENQIPQPKYLELIKTVAAPISIAVANIRVNNSLREREEERDKLMSMGFELTTIRSREELLRILKNYLPKLLDFQSVYIFLRENESKNQLFLYQSKVPALEDHYLTPGDDPKIENIFSDLNIFSSMDVSMHDISNTIASGMADDRLQAEYNAGAGIVASIPFRNDNKEIGFLAVFLNSEMQFLDYQQNIFKELSFQISNAISDMLSNEDLQRREDEKELLLFLSEDIAAVRDKAQLLRVIKKRIKPTIRFNHFAIAVKVPDNSIISFLSDPESNAKGHPQYTKVFRQERESCEDFVSYINKSATPIIFTRENVGDFSQVPDVFYVNFESGIKEILVAKLFDGISIFGYCFFFFDQHGIISNKQFGLIKGIANQLSTAIYNIKANLEIINREKDNELLISLSNTTAGIRNFSQFTSLISTKFKNVFSFDNYFVGLVHDDRSALRILREKNTAAAVNGDGQIFTSHTSEHLPISANLLNQLETSEVPQIIDLRLGHQELLGAIEYDRRYDFSVITRFAHNDRFLGIWVMFFRNLSEIDTKLFRLLQGVNDQLSNSLANILANERLARRETLKSMLLSFSTNISTARNPSDLIGIVASDMKSVLGFSHTVITIFTEKKDFVFPWVLRSEATAANHPEYEKITGLTKVGSGFTFLAMEADKPYLLDLEEHAISGSLPDHLRVNYESGIKYVMYVKLMVRNDLIGFWMLWYLQKPEVTPEFNELLDEVANIMATTISNISFTDLIKKRDQEKTSLLEFTQAIAGVQDKFELRKIFNQYLKNLCYIDDISLHWFSEDKQSQFCYFWDESAPYSKSAEFAMMVSESSALDELIFESILHSKTETSFKVSELRELQNLHPYFRLLCSQNCEDIVAVPLFKGMDMVGILFVKQFDSHTADQPLFKGLCTQLAIAVSNLIANEKVLQQLEEINMYRERLEEEKVYLKQELETTHNYSEIIGESMEIKNVFHMVSQVAAADSTVLILGETGTGKELVARAIHNNSPRKNKLLVKVNCAALPTNLIESELFGHEKGSFTGATERRVGKFELANGGSLFLDEIGEMPLELQVKLLRALQEREIERIGGKGTIKVDVRIIVATNRNLDQEVAEGRFRSDLYFRLSTFPINLPSLRHRREDIPLLAEHFVNRFAKKSGKIIDNIGQRAMQELLNYNWPGNVRELEHQIERSVIMTQGNTMKSVHLHASALPNGHSSHTAEDPLVIKTIDEQERELIIKTLRYCKGKVSGSNGAAELLGVPSTTLNAKIKRLGIKKSFSR